MVLEPRQLQGLEVLAAPPDELYEYLLHKAETNATLVVRPPQRVARQATADHAEWLANLEDRSSTVRADARAQLALRQLPELDARWVSCLLDEALGERRIHGSRM